MNKPNPNKGTVATFPGADKSEQYHLARANELMPSGLSAIEKKAWDKIAPELSKVDRLKPLFIDVIAEYCVITVRLATARKFLDDNEWTYATTGRHGDQLKSRPEVAQLNDDWRKWRSLVGELGLSPSAERHLSAAQGDLFGNDFQQF